MNLPPDFTHRAATVEDIPAVVDLINVCTQTDIGKATMSSERLAGYWAVYTSENDTTQGGTQDLVFAPDGTLAAYVEREWSATKQYFFFTIYVHPDYRTATLYDSLRIDTETRGYAWKALVDSTPDDPLSLLANVWEQETVARMNLEANGYVKVRFQKRMQRLLEETPTLPTLPPSIEIRSYRRGEDDLKIYAAWREAMSDDWSAPDHPFEQFMTGHVTSVKDFDPTLWFLAWDGDEIAGFILAQWERPGDPEAGYIRDVGVRRPWRRLGVGLALLDAAFAEFYRRGKRRVSLTVDGMNPNGANQLYEKAGMYPELIMLTYAKPML